MTRRLEVSVPARANLIGNPSDIYGGAVLACSVALYARVLLESHGGTRVHAGGQELAVTGEGDLELAGDRFDVARVVLRDLGSLPECRIRFETSIPEQSGLGGSTALLTALLYALRTWSGQPLAGDALSRRVRYVERELLGVMCGWTDCTMSSFGGLRYMEFRGLEVERPRDRAPSVTTAEVGAPCEPLPFVLAHTGVRHHSGAVHRPIRERWEAGEPEVVAAYQRIASIGSEGKQALLEADWTRLGALMNENHALQRSLGGSGESNERLIAAALEAGACGAKLAGAGQGGTIVALWPHSDPAPIEAQLRRAGAEAFFRPRSVPGARVGQARDNAGTA